MAKALRITGPAVHGPTVHEPIIPPDTAAPCTQFDLVLDACFDLLEPRQQARIDGWARERSGVVRPEGMTEDELKTARRQVIRDLLRELDQGGFVVLREGDDKNDFRSSL